MTLTKRQLRLRLQDRFQLITSYGTSTILAIILGATFFQLPPTANGGFTRGSILFIGMLVSGLDAFGEVSLVYSRMIAVSSLTFHQMPALMLGRPSEYRAFAVLF